jgi:hypothetical protein
LAWRISFSPTHFVEPDSVLEAFEHRLAAIGVDV